MPGLARLFLHDGKSVSDTEVLKVSPRQEQKYEEFGNLEVCVKTAFASAEPGDTILFSPAFSSFGEEYKNEYDRNDKFLKIIEDL